MGPRPYVIPLLREQGSESLRGGGAERRWFDSLRGAGSPSAARGDTSPSTKVKPSPADLAHTMRQQVRQ